MPGISIIVPIDGRPSVVSLCLQSLLESPWLELEAEIIVVADRDPVTRAVVRGFADRLRVLDAAEPSNFAAGCNLGARAASGEWLLFLDPRVSIDSRWPRTLVTYAREHPAIGAVGSKILHPNGSVFHAGIVFDRDTTPRPLYRDFPTDHPAVGSARPLHAVSLVGGLVSRVAFEAVGGFDTSFRSYLADVDFCLRIGERGYEVHVCPESVVTWLGTRPTRGSTADDEHDVRILRARWHGRIIPDDLTRYVEDGVLSLTYQDDGPAVLDVSPLLASLAPETHPTQLDGLPNERARPLAENDRLRSALAQMAGYGRPTRRPGPARPRQTTGAGRDPRDGRGERSGGVNVLGYLTTENGLGEAARGYIDALRHADVTVALKDISEMSPHRSADTTIPDVDDEHPHAVNLICANADQHFVIVDHVGAEYFRDRYNIGVWFWELPRFPDAWKDRFAEYDELWAPTSFIANTLAPISPIPVVRIPPVVKAPIGGSRARGRERLGVSDGERLFLFIFDFWSYVERKNPLATIEAFRLAFPESGPARLAIKCVNESVDSAAFAELTARAATIPCSILTGYWSRAEMDDLMAACDVYVSLHRSEGFGLTIAHAMALGKPVIATPWSGNADLMTVANSYPVRYDLIELQHDVGPYAVGDVWADPSISHAAELMRAVAESGDEPDERGRQARRDMQTYFSADAVGALIRQRLDTIRARRATL